MSEGMQDLGRAIVRTMSDYQPGEHTVMYGETRSEPKRIPVSDPDPATTAAEEAFSRGLDPSWSTLMRVRSAVEAARRVIEKEIRADERQRIRHLAEERNAIYMDWKVKDWLRFADYLGGDGDE